MNFFEGLGMFVVALVAFLMLSLVIGSMFTVDHTEWIYVGAWISGSIIYAITVVVMVYYIRYGGSL
jgi:hypothetical protein